MFCLSHLRFLLFLFTSPHLSFSDPYECGGLYWIVCLVLGQATSFVALYFYSRLSTEVGSKSSRDLWALLGATEAGFVTFFAIFVTAMAAKYRVTFFSTVTGAQFNQGRFQTAMTDKAKSDIFDKHPSYYDGIRDEVKAWVYANYSTWLEEQPDWFTERVKASIPKDMIPNSEDEETPVSVAEVKEERRNSVQKVKEAYEEVIGRKSALLYHGREE